MSEDDSERGRLIDTNKMVRRALSEHGWTDSALFYLFLIAIAAPLAIGVVQKGSPWEVRYIAASAGVLVAGLLFLLVMTRQRIAAERRWLTTLPIPLQLGGYLACLAKESAWATVTIEIEFDPPVEISAMKARLEAYKRIERTSHWDDGVHFLIKGKSLTTKTSYKGNSTYRNGPVHRWFRRCATELLIPLHAEHRLKTVRVRT